MGNKQLLDGHHFIRVNYACPRARLEEGMQRLKEGIKDFDSVNNRLPITGGSEIHTYMVGLAHEAMRITCELNNSYHEPEEIRQFFQV